MHRPRALAFVLMAVIACAQAGQPSATPTPAASPARQPANLAVLSEERAVLDAFRSAGLAVRLVGGSKHEDALGQVTPARAFIVAPGPVTGGFGQGADVLFLPPRLGVIEVCSRPGSAPGRTIYTVFLDGRRVSDADAVAPVHYLVGPLHFAMAYDTDTRDALEKGLGLKPANSPSLCP